MNDITKNKQVYMSTGIIIHLVKGDCMTDAKYFDATLKVRVRCDGAQNEVAARYLIEGNMCISKY